MAIVFVLLELKDTFSHRNKYVREAPFSLTPPPFGHCPNSIYTPPRTQTGTLGHFFSGAILPFYHFYHFVYHFLWISAPNHPGKGLNQANAHLNLENSSLKKCPKPSGQGFRPPPQTGNAHMEVVTSWKGLPLRQTIFITSLFGHRTYIQKIFFWKYPPSAVRPGLTSIIHPLYTGSCVIVQPVQLVDLLLFTCKPREGGSVRPVNSEIWLIDTFVPQN